MTDLEGKKKPRKEQEIVEEAVKEISQTEAGQIFFHWMANRYHFFSSIITGNYNTGEINVYGSLFNEAQRRVYLDIRRAIPNTIRQKIENKTGETHGKKK